MKGKKMYDEESSSNKTNKQDDSWDNSKNYDDKKNSFYNKISKDVEKTVPHSKGIVTSNVSDNKLKSSTNTKDLKYSNISDDKKIFNDFNNCFVSNRILFSNSISICIKIHVIIHIYYCTKLRKDK